MPQASEDLLGYDGGVVLRPAPDHWVEPGDQGCLWCGTVVLDDLPECFVVTTDRLFAGFDEGLEAEQGSLFVSSRVCFADGVLSDIEAQEVEPCCPIVGLQGVCDVGLAWL